MKNVISVDLFHSARRSSDFPKGWSDEKLRGEIRRYEMFLRLAARHPGQPLAPTVDIDAVWHLHMTHPVAYHGDCVRLLGQIFDHDGGFGSNPAELPQLKAVFARTAGLWKQEFGEPYVRASEDPAVTNCWHDCQGRCWHACSSRAQPVEQELLFA